MKLSDEMNNDLIRFKNDTITLSTITCYERQKEIDLINKYLPLVLKLEKENKKLKKKHKKTPGRHYNGG
jgi:hypothetical protein